MDDRLGHLADAAQETYARVMPGDRSSQPAPGSVAELAKTLVFGEGWRGPHLSDRERRLITLAMLALVGRNEPVAKHVKAALTNGEVTRDDLSELAVHVAFYAGFPHGTALEALIDHEVELFGNEE